MPSVYRIDHADVITAVNADWDAFARDNEGAHLTADKVVGRVLWEFISDPETEQIYRALLRRLRQGVTVPPLPFRCDSPGLRRFMELHTRPGDEQGVEFEARLLRAEPREPVALLDAETGRTGELVRICSWCKRVAVAGADWLEMEEAISRLGLLESHRPPPLTHTMCEDCLADLHGYDADDEEDG